MTGDCKLFICIALFHIIVSYSVNRMPYRTLASLRLRIVPYKKEKEIYEKVFRIKAWKDYVPSAGPFDKKVMKGNGAEYLSLFILETVRAEVIHMICLIVTFLVLLVYDQPYGWLIPVFFTMINVPCIMIQRYNRPRLENVLLLHGYDLVIPENDESFTRRLLMLRKR